MNKGKCKYIGAVSHYQQRTPLRNVKNFGS
jgi:hypothetical protein